MTSNIKQTTLSCNSRPLYQHLGLQYLLTERDNFRFSSADVTLKVPLLANRI